MSPTPISDKSLIQLVLKKLTSRGISNPCKVTVTSQHGDVTLSGSVQHAHQKASAVQVASSMSGVRRVIDCLKVVPRIKC